MNKPLECSLPDGAALIAELSDEPAYPGVRISLKKPGGFTELLCFAEYNGEKPTGKELCIGVYARNQDEPAYYKSYADTGFPSPNV
jgi:hypothetical protein